MILKESLRISGMSCAACAAKIEKKLIKLDGIGKAAVNLATERASVEYDASQIKVSDMIKAIRALGYEAEKAEEVSRDREKEQREKEIGKLKITLIVSALLSFPLLLSMVLAMVRLENPWL